MQAFTISAWTNSAFRCIHDRQPAQEAACQPGSGHRRASVLSLREWRHGSQFEALICSRRAQRNRSPSMIVFVDRLDAARAEAMKVVEFIEFAHPASGRAHQQLLDAAASTRVAAAPTALLQQAENVQPLAAVRTA